MCSLYSQGDPFDPLVDFSDYIADDESIADADLVVWATMGIHHIPSPEDVPVTMTSWNKASLSLMPFNYHSESPAVQSRDIVHLHPTADMSTVVVTRYLPTAPSCAPVFPEYKYNGTMLP